MMSRAIVFPGQGSQSVGMLTDLAETHADIKATFARVSEHLGYDLWSIVQEGPADVLNQTMYTQVAMLTADVALYTVLQQHSAIQPQMMAGHSLGEYAALVCAGALPLLDAATLVQTRGRLMQDMVPMGEGAMAAIIGLSDQDVRDLCAKSTTELSQVTPANYNALGQVVIAGHLSAVQQAMVLAEEAGARMAKLIPVSVPCHCSLLKPAAEAFAEALAMAPFQAPHLPVISNVDLSVYQSPEHIRALLQQQLYSPVRWVETIQMMKDQGVESLIECGPGKILSGLIKRIDKSLAVSTVSDELLQSIST